jgi:hypothetical protein
LSKTLESENDQLDVSMLVTGVYPVDEIPAEQTAPLLNFLDDIGGDGSDMSNFYARKFKR